MNGLEKTARAVLKKAVPSGVRRWIWLNRMPEGATVGRLERAKLFREREEKGLKNIPVFIISYNRLSYVKQMVSWLERKGHTNIVIIDNASTYPPLLAYYDTIPYEVIRMENNYGHLVFWKSDRFDVYRQDFYMLSDPDVAPVVECPNDFEEVFFRILKNNPHIKKAGFSLKIDDIPLGEAAMFGNDVYEWEKQFYKSKTKDGYFADIDTTFAMYPPDSISGKAFSYRAIRAYEPYQLRHLPWYKRKNDITEEDQFYSDSKLSGVGAWTPAKSEGP